MLVENKHVDFVRSNLHSQNEDWTRSQRVHRADKSARVPITPIVKYDNGNAHLMCEPVTEFKSHAPARIPISCVLP